MDTTGLLPKLTDADSVYKIKEYSELMATALQYVIKPPLCTVELVGTDIDLLVNVGEYPINWNSRAGDATMNGTAFPSRLIAPVDGFYTVAATAIFSNTTGGQRTVGFLSFTGAGHATRKYHRGMNHINPSQSFFPEVNGEITLPLKAGDYIEVTIEVALQSNTTSIKANQGTRAVMKYERAL